MTGSLYELDDYGEQMKLQLKKPYSSLNSIRNQTNSCNFSNDEKLFTESSF